EETKEHFGDTISVPKRGISPEGTTVDVGVLTFETGVSLTAKVRFVESGLTRLDITADISELRGFSGTLPTISHRTFESSAFVGDGGILVLGGLFSGEKSRSRDFI